MVMLPNYCNSARHDYNVGTMERCLVSLRHKANTKQG